MDGECELVASAYDDLRKVLGISRFGDLSIRPKDLTLHRAYTDNHLCDTTIRTKKLTNVSVVHGQFQNTLYSTAPFLMHFPNPG